MKFEVLKTFIDKNTKKKHEKGTKYDTNQKRGKELQELGFLGKEIKQAAKKKVDKDEPK